MALWTYSHHDRGVSCSLQSSLRFADCYHHYHHHHHRAVSCSLQSFGNWKPALEEEEEGGFNHIGKCF